MQKKAPHKFECNMEFEWRKKKVLIKSQNIFYEFPRFQAVKQKPEVLFIFWVNKDRYSLHLIY